MWRIPQSRIVSEPGMPPAEQAAGRVEDKWGALASPQIRWNLFPRTWPGQGSAPEGASGEDGWAGLHPPGGAPGPAWRGRGRAALQCAVTRSERHRVWSLPLSGQVGANTKGQETAGSVWAPAQGGQDCQLCVMVRRARGAE